MLTARYQSVHIKEDLREIAALEATTGFISNQTLVAMNEPLMNQSTLSETTPEPSAILGLGMALIITGLLRKSMSGR